MSYLVGAAGFEPAAFGTQNRRATRLRHAPMLGIITKFPFRRYYLRDKTVG